MLGGKGAQSGRTGLVVGALAAVAGEDTVSMVARIIGGAVAGWLLGIAPLAVLDALSLTSGAVDPSSTALAGAGALATGIVLGGMAAGLIGGRRAGAVAGAIAGALCAGCLIALMYALRAQGALPNLLALHPVRTMGALLFIGALVASVAWGVSALLGLRAARAEAASFAAFAAAQGAGQRQQGATADWPVGSHGAAAPGSDYGRGYDNAPSRPGPPQARDLAPYGRKEGGWEPDARRGPPASGPRQPPRSDRRPAAARYDTRDAGRDAGYESRERWSDAPERWRPRG
jgi:hypothetical protein